MSEDNIKIDHKQIYGCGLDMYNNRAIITERLYSIKNCIFLDILNYCQFLKIVIENSRLVVAL